MGLEAYLFKVEFKKPVLENQLIELFISIGMSFLSDRTNNQKPENYRTYFFELRSEMGLTEADCMLIHSKTTLDYFYLRFSIVSPKTVIDQTFEIFRKLNELHPICIYDTEINNHLYFQLIQDNKSDNELDDNEEINIEIEEKCYIEIDSDKFRQNQFCIRKREIIISNDEGLIIESGSPTMEYIRANNLFDRFLV
jgi:hypothetical protein